MLFDPFRKISEAGHVCAVKENNSQQDFISSADDYLSKHIRNIDYLIADKTYHFTSNGRFGLHDIVLNIAGKTPQPHCIVTSFNLSVIAARLFVRAWDSGIFSSLAFVLNAQKRSNFEEAVKILEGKFSMKFTSIHAKVALLWKANQYITIVTSGNLSNNQNIERGFISTSRDLFEFDKKWIDELFS